MSNARIIVRQDPVPQRYGASVICTLRGSEAERQILKEAAHRARLSLNAYVRRRLPLRLEAFEDGAGI